MVPIWPSSMSSRCLCMLRCKAGQTGCQWFSYLVIFRPQVTLRSFVGQAEEFSIKGLGFDPYCLLLNFSLVLKYAVSQIQLSGGWCYNRYSKC